MKRQGKYLSIENDRNEKYLYIKKKNRKENINTRDTMQKERE
jgi:hypothetical protein